jgi:hypothetical protein
VRIMYAAQIGVAPPSFGFFTNVATTFQFTYQRVINNKHREEFGFIGSPNRRQEPQQRHGPPGAQGSPRPQEPPRHQGALMRLISSARKGMFKVWPSHR